MTVYKIIGLFSLFFLGIYGEAEWWKSMSLYQIYPRSFKDSNGDGIGDLRGIKSKLEHLVDLKFDAFWLSPIYPSPMVDFGYDISDYRNIDPVYGTMQDFEDLLEQAHNISLKVIMDYVPNHTSDKHAWFQKSIQKIDPYTDYYIWHEGKIINGVRQPPNNWVGAFHVPAWTWNEKRQAYYYHMFAVEQPDLNYRNKYLVEEMKNVLRFWLKKGVDGFRMDAIPPLFEVEDLRDEPLSGNTDDPLSYYYTNHFYTNSLDETYEMVRQWREVLDEFDSRVMLIEAFTNVSYKMKYYEYGAHSPFNFRLIKGVRANSTAQDFKGIVDEWMTKMPKGAVANWVTGNHDEARLATRFGAQLAPAISTLALLLPGISVTYSGEEIGMENAWLSYEETVDPQGCNAGPEGYERVSRDPARTPFQWDASVSAGFSTNLKTWLPVNDNYKSVNLANEKKTDRSNYKTFLKMTTLRKLPVIKEGSLRTKLLNNDVFAFSRELRDEKSVYVVINFAHQQQAVNLKSFENAPSKVQFYYSTSDSGLKNGIYIEAKELRIPARSASVFIKAN